MASFREYMEREDRSPISPPSNAQRSRSLFHGQTQLQPPNENQSGQAGPSQQLQDGLRLRRPSLDPLGWGDKLRSFGLHLKQLSKPAKDGSK